MHLRAFLFRTWLFFLLYAVWLGLAGLLLAATERPELHLMLNNLNAFGGGDTFYTWANYLGDRRVAWVAGLLLCFAGPRRGAALLVAVIGAGLAAVGLKYGVFGPLPRPVTYFGEPTPLYLVPGIELKEFYTMPSGHTTIAFALFTTLAIQTRRWSVQAACCVLAIIAAYSRVYLSAHFLEDIVAGSLLGVACALIAHALIRPVRPAAAPGDTPARAGAVD